MDVPGSHRTRAGLAEPTGAKRAACRSGSRPGGGAFGYSPLQRREAYPRRRGRSSDSSGVELRSRAPGLPNTNTSMKNAFIVPIRPGFVHLATRTLLNDRVRLVISIGGIGFAILLILLLRGIMDGTVARSTTYIDNVGADLFVARVGVENMTLAASVLPDEAAAAIGGVEGVEVAAGIVRLPVIVTSTRDQLPATAIGYGPEGLGGPWKFKSGRDVAGPDEAVLDEALAGKLGVGQGDSVSVAGYEYRVVGISRETAPIAGKYMFVQRETLEGLMGSPGRVNFVLVKLEPGRDPEEMAAVIGQGTGEISVLTRRELSHNDRDLLSKLFLSPIQVASTAGFLVGLAIVGLTMYTTTAERLRDFGVLKAIGAPSGYLLQTVVAQAVVLCLLGYLFGLALAFLSGPVITRFSPDIGVTITFLNAGQALAAAMTLSIVGGVVPLARILRVDPLMVFKRA
ncbi:ABC transporter permease [bacterium]|nr:MAG: ABC transporter permease [bacterium]